jgi:hypothetical protein
MDPVVHKRYLDYRDRYGYFGRKKAMLSMQDFEKADAEHRALAAKGDARDDEEEARFAELSVLLFRD